MLPPAAMPMMTLVEKKVASSLCDALENVGVIAIVVWIMLLVVLMGDGVMVMISVDNIIVVLRADILIISTTLIFIDEVVECSINDVIDTTSTLLLIILLIVVVDKLGSRDVDVTLGIVVAAVNVEVCSIVVTSTADGVDDIIIILELAGTLNCELLVDNILEAVKPSDDTRIVEEMSKSIVESIINNIDDSTEEVGETTSQQLEHFTSSINKSSS